MPQDLHRQNNIILDYLQKTNVGVRSNCINTNEVEERQNEEGKKKKIAWIYKCTFKVTSPELEADIGLVKRVRPLLWGLLGNNKLKTTKICNMSVPITTIYKSQKQ